MMKLRSVILKTHSMNFTEKAFTEELTDDFKSTFFSLMQHFKQFRLVIRTLLISLFSFYNVSHFEPTSTALSFTSETVFMEGMTTHKVN